MSGSLAGKRALVTPDKHVAPKKCSEGGIDEKAARCVLKSIEIVKPDIYIDLGDVGEWNPVCHFKYKRVKRPPIDYQLAELRKDAKVVNDWLDRFDEKLDKVSCKERHLFEGNHEVWIDNLCAEYEVARDRYNVETLLKLKEREYIYHPYGDYHKFGNLAMYHGGHYAGIYHAHHHVLKLGHSVMYGHTHDQQTAKVSTLDSYHGAWSIGCLCKMQKPFLKGRPTNWSHNFAIIHFLEKGKFNVEIVEIFDGVAHVWGEKVKG